MRKSLIFIVKESKVKVTIVQPVVGECFIPVCIYRDNDKVVTAGYTDGILDKRIFSDNEILWVASELSDKDLEDRLQKYPWKKGLIAFGDTYKHILFIENPYSKDRIIFLLRDEGFYVEFSTWKNLVSMFVEYGE